MFFKKEKPAARFGKFFFTFVAGVAIGTATGLLFAPKAGKKLQKELKDGFGDLTEKALKLATA